MTGFRLVPYLKGTALTTLCGAYCIESISTHIHLYVSACNRILNWTAVYCCKETAF